MPLLTPFMVVGDIALLTLPRCIPLRLPGDTSPLNSDLSVEIMGNIIRHSVETPCFMVKRRFSIICNCKTFWEVYLVQKSLPVISSVKPIIANHYRPCLNRRVEIRVDEAEIKRQSEPSKRKNDLVYDRTDTPPYAQTLSFLYYE